MNWFKISQNNNLFNSIYQLLIVVYNSSGQGSYDELMSTILNEPIDAMILNSIIFRAKNKAIKDLNLEELTPEMQRAIDAIVSNFQGYSSKNVENPEENFLLPSGERTSQKFLKSDEKLYENESEEKDFSPKEI